MSRAHAASGVHETRHRPQHQRTRRLGLSHRNTVQPDQRTGLRIQFRNLAQALSQSGNIFAGTESIDRESG